MTSKSSYAQILKASSIMGGAAGINLLLGMLRVKFAAVFIGTTGVGLISSFGALQGLIGTLAGLGIQSSAVREIADALGKGDDQAVGRAVLALRRICWLTGLVGMAAMVLLAPKPVRAESGKLSIDRRCVLPAQMVRLDGALERTRARIDRREPLTIVAIGSSSTEGYGASSPANTYPAQLGSLLRTRYVGEPIEVINKGCGGEVATQTLARFGKDVYPNDPTLVIWQAGANDVVRNVPLEQFAATLKEGLAALRSAGIDVILMPPQYAPQTAAAKQIEAYVELIEQLGDEFDVPVVQRYELMQQLAAKDAPLLAAMLTAESRRTGLPQQRQCRCAARA